MARAKQRRGGVRPNEAVRSYAQAKGELLRAFGISLPTLRHPRIRALRREHVPTVHGHRPWDTSFLLMSYLRRQRPVPEGARVMEIGCGWGPVSAFCARELDARVTGVDVDRAVFPYLAAVAAINGVRVRAEHGRFERLTVKRLRRVDALLGSDVCFWDEMTAPLFNLVRRGSRAGVRRVVIADPGRSPFRALASRCEEVFGARKLEWSIRRPYPVEGEILDIALPAEARG